MNETTSHHNLLINYWGKDTDDHILPLGILFKVPHLDLECLSLALGPGKRFLALVECFWLLSRVLGPGRGSFALAPWLMSLTLDSG